MPPSYVPKYDTTITHIRNLFGMGTPWCGCASGRFTKRIIWWGKDHTDDLNLVDCPACLALVAERSSEIFTGGLAL